MGGRGASTGGRAGRAARAAGVNGSAEARRRGPQAVREGVDPGHFQRQEKIQYKVIQYMVF